MTASGVIRGGGLAAMAGGTLWVTVFAVYASRSQVPGPPYGSFEGLHIAGLLSLLLIALGFLGLDLPSWRGRGHGGWGGSASTWPGSGCSGSSSAVPPGPSA